ncbi:hypothetical protein, partial [Cetobacterium sp.]|uniref:hypothetical protein n=1 Tax=Cetobacterium sp. TaxID=2071632 RepID=UPI003EE5EFAE
MKNLYKNLNSIVDYHTRVVFLEQYCNLVQSKTQESNPKYNTIAPVISYIKIRVTYALDNTHPIFAQEIFESSCNILSLCLEFISGKCSKEKLELELQHI